MVSFEWFRYELLIVKVEYERMSCSIEISWENSRLFLTGRIAQKYVVSFKNIDDTFSKFKRVNRARVYVPFDLPIISKEYFLTIALSLKTFFLVRLRRHVKYTNDILLT